MDIDITLRLVTCCFIALRARNAKLTKTKKARMIVMIQMEKYISGVFRKIRYDVMKCSTSHVTISSAHLNTYYRAGNP